MFVSFYFIRYGDTAVQMCAESIIIIIIMYRD